MKKYSKIIAMLLCVIMCFSCLTVFTGAVSVRPKKLVVLGDSIAWGSGVYNSEEACYARIVADTNGYLYANYAVNGYRTADLVNLLERDYVIEDIASADIINISIGGNDFLQQNLPLLIARVAVGNYKNIDDITEIIYENYSKAINKIKEINPTAVIIAQTLYNPRADLLREIYGVAVDRVNSCIYSYLEEHPGSIEIMDVRSVFENHFDYVAVDSIHPNAAGNEAIARVMLQKLKELGLGENTEPVILNPGIDEVPFASQILGFFREMFEKITSFFKSVFAI